MIPTEISTWEGYEKHTFTFNSHEGILICPNKPRADKRWIWRAEFLGAFDTADRALLAQGWYLAYYRVSNMYGCPEAIELMKGFYDLLVGEFGLHPKTVIFGFSRGGLYAVNFAVQYPKTISALYLDAPVLDVKSWPGHLSTGGTTAHEWTECLAIYHLDEKSVLTFKGNPIDKAQDLIDAGIPVMIVAGDDDESVPHLENCQRLVDYFAAHGGTYEYILKPGCKHHPHSLENPEPIVKFILKVIGE